MIPQNITDLIDEYIICKGMIIGKDYYHISWEEYYNHKKDELKGILWATKEELYFLEHQMFDFKNMNGTAFRIMDNRESQLKEIIKAIEGELK